MTKTVGFTAYETVAVSNINPRAAVRLNLKYQYPYVILPRPSPLAATSVSAKRYPSGSLEVFWEIGPASGGVCSYLEGRAVPWQFPSTSRFYEGAAPWELLRDAVLLEKAGPPPGSPRDITVHNHLFWKQFVQDVEDIWPVADVMFR